MKTPLILADILQDYFQFSQEPLAIEFRKKFKIDVNLDAVSNEKVELLLDNSFLADWIDNQDVMQALHISPRTLQTLRNNGTLPYSRINNKIYYLKQDVERILKNNYSMYRLRNGNGKNR